MPGWGHLPGYQGTQPHVPQGHPAGPGGREHQESDPEGRGTLATRDSSLASWAAGTEASIEVVSVARSTEGVTRSWAVSSVIWKS